MREAVYGFLKRTFDIITSLFCLMVLSPFMLIVSVSIKLDSPGPVFYRGIRVGRYGRPFRIYKFRTMTADAERTGGPSTASDDPRITRLGAFLRRYKLDELPQLINVLKGEMSIVGPRPEVPMEVETYSREQMRILDVRPGITDWASLTFHDEGEILKGSPDPHEAYREKIKPEKLRLALKYIDERSFLTDMRIIFETILVLSRTRRGAGDGNQE
ncbi:MAG: sugar transferase [Nitrospirae bacterium]|nr:sugar transferase [Nitrospirota bacterium]